MRELLDELGRHWRGNEKLRFLIVGATNTGIGYLTFAMYYLMLGRWVHYIVVALIAHMTSVCAAFLLQKKLVFRSGSPWWPEFRRYNVSLLGILTFNVLTLFLLVTVMCLHPLAGQAVVMVFSIIGSYFAHKQFSFAGRKT